MALRVSSTISRALTPIRERGSAWPTEMGFRGVSLGFALTLIGAYGWVFYTLMDVVGGVSRLAAVIAGAVVLGTIAAWYLPVRGAIVVGSLLFVVGLLGYLVAFPGFERVVLTPGFLMGLSTHLTGISVLRFPKLDLWVLMIAPAPVFLSWYFALRRRYDASAMIGGVVLAFFTLTGDAATPTVLIGMASLLGLLGTGSLEDAGSTISQIEHLGFILAVGVLAARVLPVVPDWGSSVSPSSVASAGTGRPVGRVIAAEDQIDVFGHITLSPEVMFRVTADEAAYWHVAAYDRYTGSGWIRTGEGPPDNGGLSVPPGETKLVRQEFEVLSSVKTMPAAWRPVRLNRLAPNARVTAQGSLQPTQWLTPGDSYIVTSHIPQWSPESLQAAGTNYPVWVRDRYLQLPESTPDRIGEFTTQLTANATTPYETTLIINHWLPRNHGYSLDVSRPNGDIASAFLFDMDEGYCTYFATTMIVMLRTQGIPARLAIGYTSGERIGHGQWIVRGLDSHAWVEVYFPGIGWVSYDPTPSEPRRAVERTRFEPMTDGNTFDVARPNGAQATPSQRSGNGNDGGRTPSPSGGDRAETPTPSAPNATGPGRFDSGTDSSESTWFIDGSVTRDRIALLSAVAALAIGTHQLDLLRRGYEEIQLRRQPPSGSPDTDINRALKRVDQVLARQTRPRKPTESARQYLNAIDAADPRAHRLVTIYEEANYAGRATRETAAEAIELADALVSEETWF